MTKKILNGTLVAVMALTALAPLSACSLNEEIGPAIDADKTQLVIANQNRGFGDAYLEALADEFEEAYAVQRLRRVYAHERRLYDARESKVRGQEYFGGYQRRSNGLEL